MPFPLLPFFNNILDIAFWFILFYGTVFSSIHLFLVASQGIMWGYYRWTSQQELRKKAEQNLQDEQRALISVLSFYLCTSIVLLFYRADWLILVLQIGVIGGSVALALALLLFGPWCVLRFVLYRAMQK